MKIGGNVTIEAGSNTNIRLDKVFKDDKAEKNTIYLSAGRISCDVTLPTQHSEFEIWTDTVIFFVKGTRFSVKVTDDSCILNVESGKVGIRKNISKKVRRGYLDFWQKWCSLHRCKRKKIVNETKKLLTNKNRKAKI